MSRIDKETVRRLWLLAHRWLGLTLGLLLALLGLTGSLNVVSRELDVSFHPELAIATPTPHPAGIVRILEIAAAAAPEPTRFLMAPDWVQPVWTAYFERGGDRWTISIDPGSGRVLGVRDLDRTWLMVLYRLHADLLLPGFYGEQAIGVLGLVLLLLAGSGVWLWMPRQLSPRAFWQLRMRPHQVLYLDLHRLAGIWSATLLLLVALAGVGVVFPGLIRPLVALVSSTDDRDPSLPTGSGLRAIDADCAVAIALAAAPAEQLAYIEPPGPAAGAWQIGLRWPDASTAERNSGAVWIDAATGRILADQTGEHATAGTRFMRMQLWLHNGSVFGWQGRLVVFLAGLSLPTLYVSGLLAWARKRANRRRLGALRRSTLEMQTP